MMHKGLNQELKSIWQAVDHCIELNIPFACAALPACDLPVFFASLCSPRRGTESSRTSTGGLENSRKFSRELESSRESSKTQGSSQAFLISFFGSPDEAVWISADLNAQETIDIAQKYPGPEITPTHESTGFEEYDAQATALIDKLACSAGKTVLSSVIAVKSHKPLTQVIRDYFDRFPLTMRFVYFTPKTGLWFGASPELILDYDNRTRELRTMSLAGTRPLSKHQEAWDAKNLREHQFVTDFILEKLSEEGINAEVTDSTPLRFGEIEHLCDRIHAHGVTDPLCLLARLSPTPALCGYPRHEATEQIHQFERHSRHCYGGWIAISDADGIHAYVNLRSAFAAPLPDGSVLYNIYVGGGLTSDSDVAEEWLETRAKAKILYDCITK